MREGEEVSGLIWTRRSDRIPYESGRISSRKFRARLGLFFRGGGENDGDVIAYVVVGPGRQRERRGARAADAGALLWAGLLGRPSCCVARVRERKERERKWAGPVGWPMRLCSLFFF